MKILKSTLPAGSILNTGNLKPDYIDSFCGTFSDKGNKLTSAEIGKAFFKGSPKWVKKLMTFRDKIVSVFGLETSGNKQDKALLLAQFRCEPGEQLGLFKVFAKTENEVVLGQDDKHLDFRVSLFTKDSPDLSKKILIISTAVKFNHFAGKLYFLPVKPFHKLIVPFMLKGILKELEKHE